MAYWTGTLHSSGTITSSSNSGWVAWPLLDGQANSLDGELYRVGPLRGLFRMEPSDLATDETLDLVLACAFDSSGNGAVDIHTFTQVTSSNTAETIGLPAGSPLTTTNQSAGGMPMGSHYQITWTVAGSTPSMSFVIYAALHG